jgi:hypothetical protein
MALDEGYAWNDCVYRSLSQVAKAITGTNWNGHGIVTFAQYRHFLGNFSPSA